MAINFPSTVGQPTNGSYTYTVSGITYSWDGSSWQAAGAGASATDRSLFSVTTNSAGSPALSYDSNTGVFSYTPPLGEADTLQSVVDRGTVPHLTTDIQIRAKLDFRPPSGVITNAIIIDPVNAELKLYDNTKALFGFSDDLEIYHSNPNNYIKSKQGTLKIQGDAITLENEDGSEQYIECVDGGGVTVSGLTYPTTNGTSGDVLTSDGTGNVTWQAPTGGGGGGSGLTSRTTASVTQSIANNGVANVSFTTAKAMALMKIETSHAAWVTLYSSTSARTNDAGRLETTDPTPGSGVLSEVITAGNVAQLITPATVCFNAVSYTHLTLPTTFGV